MGRVLQGRIELRKGVAYFRHSDTMFSEPARLHSFWRIDAAPELFEHGQDATLDLLRNVYMVRREPFETIEVSAGGTDEPAEFVEHEDIEPPRTRLETRWNGTLGCWERYTAKGWR